MAAPKSPPMSVAARPVIEPDRKPKVQIRASGKTADHKLPVGERQSVKRAVMRLPDDRATRRRYLDSIGVGGPTASNLLNRVDGLHLPARDGHGIALQRLAEARKPKVRRKRRRNRKRVSA